MTLVLTIISLFPGFHNIRDQSLAVTTINESETPVQIQQDSKKPVDTTDGVLSEAFLIAATSQSALSGRATEDCSVQHSLGIPSSGIPCRSGLPWKAV